MQFDPPIGVQNLDADSHTTGGPLARYIFKLPLETPTPSTPEPQAVDRLSLPGVLELRRSNDVDQARRLSSRCDGSLIK